MSAPSFTTASFGGLVVAALVAVAGSARAADPPATGPTATPPAPATPGATPAPAAPPPSSASPEAAAPATEPAAGDKPESSDDADAEATDDEEAPEEKGEKAKASPPAVVPITAAGAPPTAEEPNQDDGLRGSHQEHWSATIGGRFGYFPSAGYDPFSENNGLGQVSLGLGRTVMAMDEFSAAVSLLWDWGAPESTARGAATSLDVHRLTAGLEGRYHLFRRLYFFARFAPGALRYDATLQDGGAGVERTAGGWLFAGDLSGGAAFEFAGENRGHSTRPRGWLSADGGYGFTTTSTLEFVAEPGSGAPARLEPINFGDFSMSGGFFRIAAAITY